MMRYNHRGLCRLLMTSALLLMAGAASSGDGPAAAPRLVIDPGTFQSIPSAEAAETRRSMSIRSAGLMQAGPRIMLRRPENDSVFRPDEPVTVYVEFLPAADGSAPDMATLNIRVRKGWLGKDITDAVEPYVRGPAIEVPNVDFSGHTGSFRFEIRIRDYRNRESEVEFRIRVSA